jgi:hypothetical protein
LDSPKSTSKRGKRFDRNFDGVKPGNVFRIPPHSTLPEDIFIGLRVSHHSPENNPSMVFLNPVGVILIVIFFFQEIKMKKTGFFPCFYDIVFGISALLERIPHGLLGRGSVWRAHTIVALLNPLSSVV